MLDYTPCTMIHFRPLLRDQFRPPCPGRQAISKEPGGENHPLNNTPLKVVRNEVETIVKDICSFTRRCFFFNIDFVMYFVVLARHSILESVSAKYDVCKAILLTFCFLWNRQKLFINYRK